MKNAVHMGHTIAHTPTAAVAAGGVAVIGARIGIAINDVAANVEGVFSLEGVYTLAKLSTDVVTRGAVLYWDAGNSRLTLTASTHVVAGFAHSAAGSGVSTVDVKINA